MGPYARGYQAGAGDYTGWYFCYIPYPDLSFNKIKGLSTKSGVDLRLMFMDALIKRKEKGVIFFDALARSVSVVTVGISKYMSIKFAKALEEENINVNFTDRLPNDLAEAISTLVEATGDKPILSQETAARISPFTGDAKEEVTRLKGEGTINEQFEI